jgi:hypothetical protein
MKEDARAARWLLPKYRHARIVMAALALLLGLAAAAVADTLGLRPIVLVAGSRCWSRPLHGPGCTWAGAARCCTSGAAATR